MSRDTLVLDATLQITYPRGRQVIGTPRLNLSIKNYSTNRIVIPANTQVPLGDLDVLIVEYDDVAGAYLTLGWVQSGNTFTVKPRRLFVIDNRISGAFLRNDLSVGDDIIVRITTATV